MTIQECYKEMGADYEEVQGRLRTEERIKKFVLNRWQRMHKICNIICYERMNRNCRYIFLL